MEKFETYATIINFINFICFLAFQPTAHRLIVHRYQCPGQFPGPTVFPIHNPHNWVYSYNSLHHPHR